MNKKILLNFSCFFVSLLIGSATLFGQNVLKYTEDFKLTTGTTMPAGWTTTNSASNTSANAFWKIGPWSGSPNYDVQGATEHTGNGGNYCWVDGSSPYPIINYLETKTFDFKNHWNLKLEFWHISYNSTYSAQGHNTFDVDFYDGVQWHLKVFTQKGNNPSKAWYKKSIDLSQYPPQGNEQVKFRFTVNKNAGTPFYNDILIDDFSIEGEEAMLGGNNAAAIGNVDENVCPGVQDINVRVQNRGFNIIDSVEVHWTLDGVAQPMVKYKGMLDTITGQNASIAVVTLGKDTFQMGVQRDIKYWTSMPNGVADTINDNDTAEFKLGGALHGVLSVGGPGADFAKLDTVEWLLNNIGICAPITFQLADSNFRHRLQLNRVPGNTSINTITFESKSGNKANSSITDTSTNAATNYVVILDTTSYVTFKNLTLSNGTRGSYGGVVDLRSDASNVTFDNCHILSTYSGSSANAYLIRSVAKDQANNIEVKGCTLEGGSWAVHFEGEKNKHQSDLAFKNNTFMNQYRSAIWLRYVDDVNITSNTMSSNSTYQGVSAVYLDITGGVEVYGNQIMSAQIWPRIGLQIISSTGLSTKKNIISTNSFSLGDTNSAASDTKTGISLDVAAFFDVNSNSVSIVSKDKNSSAFKITNSSGNTVLNNVFTSMGTDGLATDVSGLGSILSMNNNLLYSTANLGKFNGSNQQDLAAWQSNTGFDAKSISEDPIFRGVDDLNMCSKNADNIGTGFGLVVDFAGALRHPQTPDPGAYEYSAITGITVDDQRVCKGDTATFFVAKGANDIVIWNNTDTAQTFRTTTTGIYSMTALGVCGADTTNFMVINNDLVKLGNDTNICGGDTLNVESSVGNATYSWSNGNTTRDIDVTMNGQYIVNVVDSDGCRSADTIEVTVSQMAILRSDTTVCNGHTIELDPGTPGGNYTWFRDGISISTGTKIFAGMEGKYAVTYTDAKNCTSSDTFNLTVKNLASSKFTWTQNQNNYRFEAVDTNGTNYHWSFGDGKSVSGPAWHTLNKYIANKAYNVTLVVTSDVCGDSTTTNEVLVEGVGINDLANSEGISVYPNPSNGVINVNISTLNVSKELNLEIITADGKVVYQKDDLNMGNNQLDVTSTVSTGMYFIRVKTDQEIIYTGKISIK